MKIVLDENALMPVRKHPNDAGLDLKTPYDFYIAPHSRYFIDTGVHVMLPPNTVGMLKSRSGLNKFNGVQCEGVVDENYTGSIGCTIYNHSEEIVRFKRGDRIAQLVILPIFYPDLEQISELPDTDRGQNGFGSTGKN